MSSTISTEYIERCRERTGRWLDFCNEEYVVGVPIAELVAAVFVPGVRAEHLPVWLVAETNTHPFWTDLSLALPHLGFDPVYDVEFVRKATHPLPQAVTPHHLESWKEIPRIAVDLDWEDRNVTKGLGARSPYWRLCARSLRAFLPLQIRRVPSNTTWQEMARLLSLIIDKTHRQIHPEPVPMPEPVHALASVIEVINREFVWGEMSERQLGLLIAARASLHGRSEVVDRDWEIVRPILRSSIKAPYRKLFRYYYENVKFPKYYEHRHTSHLPNRKQFLTLMGWERSGKWIPKRNVDLKHLQESSIISVHQGWKISLGFRGRWLSRLICDDGFAFWKEKLE